MCKQTRCCKLSLHERHRKYVWSDINKCSPPVAVTAGIAGANLISQGEVSLVVWRGEVGWGGVGGRVLAMHDCKHALYPNQVSPWRLISPRKLVTNPRQRVGRGGRTKEKSCHERTGWWCWWQWWWMKKSLPISGLCRLSLSLSLPLPLTSLPSSCFSSFLSVATCSTHFRCIKSPLYVWYFHSEENLNRSCHARASQPPTKLPKRKKQTKS